MSTYEQLAALEIPASGSDVSFAQIALADVGHAKSPVSFAHAGIRLLVNMPKGDALTGSLIQRLTNMAVSFFRLDVLTVKTQFGDERLGRHSVWYALEDNHAPVRLGTAADIADYLHSAKRLRAGDVLLVEFLAEELSRDSPVRLFEKAAGTLKRAPFFANPTVISYVHPTSLSESHDGVQLRSRQAAIAFRDELLARGWPNSTEVAQLNGTQAGNSSQWASDKRRAGELLGVWSASTREYVHPDFQFDKNGSLRRQDVRALLQALAMRDEFTREKDRGGWQRAFWLYGKSPMLLDESGEMQTPAERFAADPEAVIELARKEAEGLTDDQW